MTALSTKIYILYNKTIIRRRNVLVQHVVGRNVLVRNVREQRSRSKTSRDETSWVRNVQVHRWWWEWYWENLWAHTYHQIICISDLSKGLEIMRCSNKVPKSVTHDVTRGRTDNSYSSMYIWALMTKATNGMCAQRRLISAWASA